MADGRRNNGGHSTKGRAGRKPKVDEIAKLDMMDSIAAPKEAWESLWKLCKKGDTQAIKTWIDHRFGKPKETKNHHFDNLPFDTIVNEFRDFKEPTSTSS